MLLSYQKTGGFANLTIKHNLDTANLTPERNTELQNLLAKILPFNKLFDAVPGADLQHYILRIEEDGKDIQTLEVDDGNVSDEMQAVFDFVMEGK